MPQMSAQLLDGNGAAVPGTVQFTVQMEYHYITQPCGSNFYNTQLYTSAFNGPPAPGSAAAPWNVDFTSATGIRGGKATISWNYQSSPVSPTQIGSFAFLVLGTNPSVAALRSRLAVINAPWFMERITWHETHARQFCPLAAGSDASPYCTWPPVADQDPPAVQGTPIFGCPGGYGLFQLDPSPNALPLDQLWDWRSNASAAVSKIASNGGVLNWNLWISAMDTWNSTHDASEEISMPSARQEGAFCSFSFARSAPNTSGCSGSANCGTWFADAVTLKRNAGVGLGPSDYFYDHSGSYRQFWDYIRLDGSQPPDPAPKVKPEWVVKTTTGYVDAQGVPRQINQNIVLDFCNSVIPF